MPKHRKVLIIKTGFSEFLDRGISTTVSLGDVLFCTTILHLYRTDEVTWVTSWAARELLDGNPYIGELMIFGPATFKKLAGRSFDIVINLEKDIGICTYMSQLKARQRYGFYFDPKRHDIAVCNRSTEFLLSGQENHKNIRRSYFEILYESVGAKWEGQGAVLNRPRRTKVDHDIGFNYSVGSKWPTKAWPMDRWKKLEKLVGEKYTITWQKGHNNLGTYIDWIDRNRLIVTSDSLGQVIAHALGKKVISLFGPTNHLRLQGLDGFTVVASTLKCPHLPCYLPFCQNDKFCMEYIAPERVAGLCERILG